MNKKRILPIFLALCLCVITGKLHAQNPLPTDRTAFTVEPNCLEISLFRPSKYGLTRKDQFALHPLGFFAMPHFFYKRRWLSFKIKKRDFFFSSRHGIYYPHFALKINKQLDWDSTRLQPDSLPIPHALAFQNELLLSHFLLPPSRCQHSGHLVTARLGCKYSFSFSDTEHPLIYQSILYRETVVLSPGFVWYAGLDFQGYLNYMFNYFADVDFYAHEFVDTWSVEARAGISGYWGRRWSGFAGIKGAYSVIPDKNRWLVMPIAGISYTLNFQRKAKHGTGLFKEKEAPFKHDNSLDRDDAYYERREAQNEAGEKLDKKRKKRRKKEKEE